MCHPFWIKTDLEITKLMRDTQRGRHTYRYRLSSYHPFVNSTIMHIANAYQDNYMIKVTLV